MKKLAPVLAAAALATGFVVLAGFHGGCGRSHRHDPSDVARFVGERLDDALDDLDATPEQRARLHAVKDRLLAEGQALRQGQVEARRELVAQWDAASPDAARVHALVDARAEALRAFAHRVADAAVEIHGVLTPEQRAKVSRKIHRRMGE